MSASPDFESVILDEIASIQDEVDAIRPLLDKLRVATPDLIELRAMGATLHAFYTGVERVLLLIAKHIDHRVPQSGHWHRDLLNQMTSSTDSRPSILSFDVSARLADFLAFRHVFRHSYSDQLRWELMQPLANDMGRTLRLIQSSVNRWLNR